MPYQPLGKKKKKDLKGISSSCRASGWVREGVVMNSGVLPPRVASSQLGHHILLLVLPAPASNNLCSSAQAGAQRRPQIFTEEEEKDASF